VAREESENARKCCPLLENSLAGRFASRGRTMDDSCTPEQLADQLMSGQPIADLRLLAPLVASPNWKVQLRAVRALTRQREEGAAPDKFEALIRGAAIRPIALPMELLDAIASHDDERAVALLLDLVTEFPGKRAIWEVLARKAPNSVIALLFEVPDQQLFDLRESLGSGPLAHALAADSSPALARRFVNLLPTGGFAEGVVRSMKQTIVGPELLRAYKGERYRYRGSSRLVAELGGSAAIAELTCALADPLREVRSLAAQALVGLGEPAFPAVRHILEQGGLPALELALNIVSQTGDPRAVPALRRLLLKPHRTLQPKILEVLARVAGAEAEDDVVPFSRTTNRALRKASAAALRYIPTRASASALMGLALSPNPEVAATALDSLVVLSRDSPVGTDEMLALLDRSPGELRAQVEEAIVGAAWIQGAEWMAAIDRLQATTVQSQATDPAWARTLNALRTRLSERLEQVKSHASHDQLSYLIVDSEPEPPAVPSPPQLGDDCYFSVFAPEQVKAPDPFIVEVWCHPDDPSRFEAPHWPDSERIRSQGPFEVPIGAVMSVSVAMAGFAVSEESGTLLWRGRTGVVGFELRPSPTLRAGTHSGLAKVSLGGMPVASIWFTLELAAETKPAADRTASVKKISSAFASYATEDRDDVLGRIQGMQKVLPSLDIFLDVLTLRSGECWQQRIDEEIAQRDALFLFWSKAASHSTWVDYEWRQALALRGLEFIDPVPLDPPSVAPVPEELAKLHFNDWTVQLSSGRAGT
jgi:hypothetical protein